MADSDSYRRLAERAEDLGLDHAAKALWRKADTGSFSEPSKVKVKHYKVELFVESEEDPDWLAAEIEDFVHDLKATRLSLNRLGGSVEVFEVSR